jgi:urease accessory protein
VNQTVTSEHSSRVLSGIETPVRRAGASRPIVAASVFAAIAFLLPAPAAAHDESGVVGGFVSGFLHPLSGLDHALAMIAVGLWGAILGRPLIAILPVVFPMTMAFGGALGVAQVPMAPVELGIAGSVIALGTLVALAVRAHAILASLIVAAFAIFHGYAHGQEAPSVADPVGYSVGFVLCTGLLHLAGIALGAFKNRPRGMLTVRAVGVVIALSGLYFAAGALTT